MADVIEELKGEVKGKGKELKGKVEEAKGEVKGKGYELKGKGEELKAEVKAKGLEVKAKGEEVKIPSSEDLLTVIEKGEKPWYLSTNEIYKIIKGAVKIIPHSEELFEKALNAIALLTKYVNESTRVKIAFDTDQTYELINKLDGILSEQLVAVDDGFDSLRIKLSTNLRLLLAALVKHREWVETYAKEKHGSATKALASRYEHAILVLKLWIESAEKRFPKATKLALDSLENFKSTVETGKQLYHGKVPEYLQDYAARALHNAQPYVHRAVNYSRPLVQSAVDVSHPYYDKALPYITPVVDKAQTLETSLKSNARYGPYVTKAIDTSYLIYNEIIAYATPVTSAE